MTVPLYGRVERKPWGRGTGEEKRSPERGNGDSIKAKERGKLVRVRWGRPAYIAEEKIASHENQRKVGTFQRDPELNGLDCAAACHVNPWWRNGGRPLIVRSRPDGHWGSKGLGTASKGVASPEKQKKKRGIDSDTKQEKKRISRTGR